MASPSSITLSSYPEFWTLSRTGLDLNFSPEVLRILVDKGLIGGETVRQALLERRNRRGLLRGSTDPALGASTHHR
jgi:hypothetical protein